MGSSHTSTDLIHIGGTKFGERAGDDSGYSGDEERAGGSGASD